MAIKYWGAGSAAGTDGNWNNPANWDGDTLPVGGDDVIDDQVTPPPPCTIPPSSLIQLRSFFITEAFGTLTNVDISGGGIILSGGSNFQGYFSDLRSYVHPISFILMGSSFSDFIMTADSFVFHDDQTSIQTLYVREIYSVDASLKVLNLLAPNAILGLTCGGSIHETVKITTPVSQVVANQNQVDLSIPDYYTNIRVKQSQSFTTNATDYKINRIGCEATVRDIKIYLADANQKPTGNYLAWIKVQPDQNSFASQFKEIHMNYTPVTGPSVGYMGGITLSPNTNYCIVFEYDVFVNVGGGYPRYLAENSGAGESYYHWNGASQNWELISNTQRKYMALHFIDYSLVNAWYWQSPCEIECYQFAEMNYGGGSNFCTKFGPARLTAYCTVGDLFTQGMLPSGLLEYNNNGYIRTAILSGQIQGIVDLTGSAYAMQGAKNWIGVDIGGHFLGNIGQIPRLYNTTGICFFTPNSSIDFSIILNAVAYFVPSAANLQVMTTSHPALHVNGNNAGYASYSYAKLISRFFTVSNDLNSLEIFNGNNNVRQDDPANMNYGSYYIEKGGAS